MSVLESEPVKFTGEDALSEGIVHAMESNEGVAIAQGLYGPQDTHGLDTGYPADPTNADEVFETKLQANFSSILELLGSVSEEAKRAIIDGHFADFPIGLTTADIGLVRQQIIWNGEGASPHIDQQDRRKGDWLPPSLYTGVSISVPQKGQATWQTWDTDRYGLLDNMSTKHPMPIVRKSQSPDEKNIEVAHDESGLVFDQSVGDIVVIRQGTVIHRVRRREAEKLSRITGLADITILLDWYDLSVSEIQSALEWAEEKRREFLRQAVVKSAVRLEPAQ